MRIAILDYAAGRCDAIIGVPKEKVETDGWVEEFLGRIGYRVQDCYWMSIDDSDEDYDGAGSIYEYGYGQNGDGDVNTLDSINF